MMQQILNAGSGVYLLWGIGLLGLLLTLITDVYLKSLVKASENMATTKKRKLCVIKRKYENGRSLGIRNGSGEAYAEKTVRDIKMGVIPLEMWRRSGKTLVCVTMMTMAGAFIYYDASWRGSPEMEYFLVNGVIISAFLLCLENIFLIKNKMEILKANIRDYLENLTPTRCAAPRPTAHKVDRGKEESAAAEILEVDSNEHVENSTRSVYEGRASDEELLNDFLKEFFS